MNYFITIRVDRNNKDTGENAPTVVASDEIWSEEVNRFDKCLEAIIDRKLKALCEEIKKELK